MDYLVNIYASPIGGFGYTVISTDGTVSITQDFMPGVSGFVPMTEAEAQAQADAEVSRLTAPQ